MKLLFIFLFILLFSSAASAFLTLGEDPTDLVGVVITTPTAPLFNNATGSVNASVYWGNYYYGDYNMPLIKSFGYNQTNTELFYNMTDTEYFYNFSLTPPKLNNISDPDNDVSFNMNTRSIQWLFTNPNSAGFEVEASGAFNDDLIHVHQHTGNPSNLNLIRIEAEDTDILPLNITGVSTWDAWFENNISAYAFCNATNSCWKEQDAYNYTNTEYFYNMSDGTGSGGGLWEQDGIAIANDTSDVRIDNGLFYYNRSRTMLALGENDQNGIYDAIVSSNIGDSLLVTDSSDETSGSQRTAFFFSEYNGTGTSSGTLYGFNSFVYWYGGDGTAIGQLGSGAGGRYAFRLGSNNEIKRATGVSSLVQTVASSTGTIQNADAYVSEGGNTVSTSTIVNYTGFRARDYTSEDVTHNYGFSCDLLDDGSSSNYCFYDDYANNNYLRYLGVGSKTMEASSSLTVGGGTIAFSDATYGLAWMMPNEGSVRYGVKVGTAGNSNDEDIIALVNRAAGGIVQIQADDDTGGAGGETLVASFNASGGYARQGIGTATPGVTALNNYENFNQLHVKGTNVRIIGEGSGQAALVLMDTGAATNDKWMDIIVDGGLGKIRAINDASSLKYNIINVNLTDGNVFFPQAYSNDLAAETTAIAYLSANGELGIDTSSSEELKTNIREATTNDNCWENLDWKVYDRANGGRSNELGLIAGEVSSVCPQYTTNKIDVIQVPYEVPAWTEDKQVCYTPEPTYETQCHYEDREVPVMDTVGEHIGSEIKQVEVCKKVEITYNQVCEIRQINHPATTEYRTEYVDTGIPYYVRYDLIARDMAVEFNDLKARVAALEARK